MIYISQISQARQNRGQYDGQIILVRIDTMDHRRLLLMFTLGREH